MPLRLNVLADTDIREQVLALVREQLRPLVREEVQKLITSEEVHTLAAKEVKTHLRVTDVHEFRDGLRREILASLTYEQQHQLLPAEAHAAAKVMVEAAIARWMDDGRRKEIANTVRAILRGAAVA